MNGDSYHDSKSHWVFALLLGIAGLLILLIFINLKNKADDGSATTTYSASSTAPVISSFTMCDYNANHATGGVCGSASTTITLAESNSSGTSGGNTIYLTGTVTDANTMDEFDDAGTDALTYYVTNGSIMSCAPDSQADRTCYSRDNQNTVGCILQNGYLSTATSATFSCAITLHYNAQPGATWTAAVRAKDGATYTDNEQLASNFTIASTTAVSVPSDITFTTSGGAVPLGTVSDAQSLTVYNVGNTTADYKVYATDMSCTKGSSTINASDRIAYSLSSVAYGSMTSSTESLGTAALVDANITPSTASTTVSSRAVYTRLHVPSSGVGGTCSGTVVFTSQES